MEVSVTTAAKLAFPRVQQAVAERAATVYGQERARALHPFTNAHDREFAHTAVSELLDSGLALGGISDIRPHITAVQDGKMLTGEEILQIAYTLDSAMSVKRAIVEGEPGALYTLGNTIGAFDGVLRLVREQLDTDGSVRDSASPKLRDIRSRLHPLRNRIRDRLQGIMARHSEAIQDPIITLRRERYVIPVIAGMHGRMHGLILDRSGSGQTVFVEPQAVVDLNNELALLLLEERDEVRRILIALQEAVALHPDIPETLTAIGELDLHNAAGKLAKDWQLRRPSVGAERIKLEQARHPLIENCVPNTITMGEDRMLIITGPNAGGKTVLLKTVGLAAMMAMSGLFVAAAGTPELPEFRHLVSDIGDEQSIEASLSTYAGHLTNLRHILHTAEPDVLVLIDELGSGTDPDEGAALSQAILEQVLTSRAFALVTSHLAPLKVFAAETSGVQNAAMVFDVEKLEPTYQLVVGQPGRSYALAIAGRIGLPENILTRAEYLLGDGGQTLEQLLITLEQQRSELAERLETTRAAEQQAVAEAEVLREQITTLRSREAEVVAEAAEKAEQLVSETLQQATRLRQRATKSGEERSRALDEIQQLRETVKRKQAPKRPPRRAPAAPRLAAGVNVDVPSYGASGTVLELRGEKALVQVGLIKMELPVSDLVVKAAQPRAPEPTLVAPTEMPREIHIRGERAEAAIERVRDFVLEAAALKMESVRIVHGKGSGVLRNVVREYLASERVVESYSDATPYEGGHGVTVAVLKT